MKYTLVVTLWSGDEITITCQHVDAAIYEAESYYGDAMQGWSLKAA